MLNRSFVQKVLLYILIATLKINIYTHVYMF